MFRTVHFVFFASASELREWFEAHHASAVEVWVGVREKGGRTGGVTLAEALDHAMCFGWVDNMTWRVDDGTYMLRFTPGQPRNVARAEELRAEGLMHTAGIRALERSR